MPRDHAIKSSRFRRRVEPGYWIKPKVYISTLGCGGLELAGLSDIFLISVRVQNLNGNTFYSKGVREITFLHKGILEKRMIHISWFSNSPLNYS